MVTAGFDIPPALVRPLVIVIALAGGFFIGTGFYDLLIDHQTKELFAKRVAVIITRENDAEHFYNLVCYRLLFGTILLLLAHVLHRLDRW